MRTRDNNNNTHKMPLRKQLFDFNNNNNNKKTIQS